MGHHEKCTKKPLLTRFHLENVLFRCAGALNSQPSISNSSRGCQPALDRTGGAGCAGYIMALDP